MTGSWKIGAISGLIASLFTGTILGYTLSRMAISMELFIPYWIPIEEKSIIVEILLNIIWGTILGIIYSKAYHAIPGKGVWKGIYWGIILYIIIAVRIIMYWLAYAGRPAELFTWLHIILYGLITGTLYEFLCSRYCPIKDLKIQRYSLIRGFHPAAIAGFCGGLAASIVAVVGPAMGLWPVLGGPSDLTFDFWLGQAGSHIFINLFWGTIFGLMFTRAYDLVPGKGISKGLVYGLTIYLITTFQLGTYLVFMAAYAEVWPVVITFIAGMFGTGFANGFVFALVLGLLYRKPAEVPSLEKEEIEMVKMVKCIHCGASIPKDSKYCKECSKQQ